MNGIESWLLLAASIFLVVMGSVMVVLSRSPGYRSSLPPWLNQWAIPGLVWGGGVLILLLNVIRKGLVNKIDIMFIIIAILVIVGSIIFMLIGSRKNLRNSMPPLSAPSALGHLVEGGLTLDHDTEREIQILLSQQKKVEAIRKVREFTGVGLKEAKDYVESLESYSNT